MEIQTKITNMIANFEKAKESHEKMLAEIKEKHPNFDRHYSIVQKEKHLEKMIYGCECRLEILKLLSTH
jgi:hypothetical protein